MDSHRLLRVVKGGDFKNALLLMNITQFSTSQAVEIFVCICTACANEPANNNFTIEELSKMITYTLNRVIDPTDSEKKTFVSSSFHILKYLIRQDASDTILNVKEAWYPKFITIDTPSESIGIYKSQCRLICEYLRCTLKSPNAKRIEELGDLLVIMTDKLAPVVFFTKSIFSYFQYFLVNVENEMILSKLVHFLLRKCLKQKGYEHELLELLFEMFTTREFPINVLHEVVIKYDEKIDHTSEIYGSIFYTLKQVVKYGISTKSLSLIYSCMKLIKNHEDELLYIWITKQIFSNFFYHNLYPCKHNLTWEFQEILSKILLPLSKILAAENRKCQKCANYIHAHDIPSQLSALLIIMGTFQKCLLTNEEIPTDLMTSMMNLYNEVILLIRELRNKKCGYWEIVPLETFTTLYNTAVYIDRKEKYPKYVCAILELLVTEYLYLEPFIPCDKIIKYNCIHTCLTVMADNYLALGEMEKAMTTITFNILECNKELTACRCVTQWIQVKTSNKKDLTIKKITMPSLVTNSHFRKFKNTLSENEILYLLLKEIRIYRTIWQSKIPLAECCQQIYNFNNPLLTIEALSLAWLNIPESILPEMFHIISNTLKQIESFCTSNKEKIDIAKMYFLKYHTHIRTLEQEMSNEIAVEPQEPEDYENYRYGTNVPDSKWDCNINEQLKVESLHLIKVPLLKSRHIIENLFSSLDSEEKDLIYKMDVLEHIVELAFTFLLHGDRIEYLKTLLFCKKVAEMLNADNWTLKTIGWILRELDVKSTLPLFNEALQYLDVAESSAVIDFYINISFAYLGNGDIENATQYYQKAKEMFTSTKVTDTILPLELEFLEWNLMGLPCQDAIDGHDEDFIMKSSDLFNKLHSLCQDCRNSRFKSMVTHYLMHAQVRYHYWLRCPREGRAVAKPMVNLCKSYILPLRFAEVFAYLGNMDLMCEKLDDCQAKVNGLSVLLDVTTTNVEPTKSLDVDLLTSSFQEIALDVSPPMLTCTASSSSPTLNRDTFKYPHFMSHNATCECFYCTSTDYQKLVLAHIVLKGNLWASRNEFNNAELFYTFALQIYNRIINKKDEYMQKVKNLLNINFAWDIEKIFAECYANILYNQGKIFVCTRRYNKVSDELIKAVERIKFLNPFLYNEAYLQKLNHSLSTQQAPCPFQLSPVPTDRSGTPIKTPEDNITTVKVATSISPKPTRHRIVETIECTYSSDEDECTESSKCISPTSSGTKKKVSKQRNTKTTTLSTATTTKSTITATKIKVYRAKETLKPNEAVEDVRKRAEELTVPRATPGTSSSEVASAKSVSTESSKCISPTSSGTKKKVSKQRNTKTTTLSTATTTKSTITATKMKVYGAKETLKPNEAVEDVRKRAEELTVPRATPGTSSSEVASAKSVSNLPAIAVPDDNCTTKESGPRRSARIKSKQPKKYY